MTNESINSIARIIILILIQVLLLQNFQLAGYINPFLYILAIMWLPLEVNKSLVMIAGFFIGLSVDVFTNTIGMHSFACVTLAFVRPYVLKLINPRDGYEPGTKPNAEYFGWPWFISYATIMTLVHHVTLFYVEAWSLSEFFYTLLRVISSGIFSVGLIILTQFITMRRK